MNKFLGLALLISASAPMIAHAKAAKAASLQSISEKYGGSNIEKRILLRECHEANLESLLEVCSKKAADLSSADIDLIKSELASASESSQPSAVVEEKEMVSSNQANINVSSGNGVQQSTTTTTTGGSYMDCIQRATTNVNRVVSSLNARMAGRFANKK